MKIPVESIAFKRITTINARAFLGLEQGQYDLRLSSDTAFATFVRHLPSQNPTNLGGWTKTIPLAPFDGPKAVRAASLDFRYMGPRSSRKDFYFPSVTTNPYPLWSPGRAFPKGAKPSQVEGDVALLIKDADGRFHARWVRKKDLSALPAQLRSIILKRRTGVYKVPKPRGATSYSSQAQEIVNALLKHYNVLLYGPPGTGKSHLVREVMDAFKGGGGVFLDTTKEQQPLSEGENMDVRSAWTTFHQSYSYEDFLIGLRPTTGQSSSPGTFSLAAVPGVLLELAEWARRPGNSSLLVIDEINRGNVSRIFGEFITLMEPDKRLAEDGKSTKSTVAVRLPFMTNGETVSVALHDGSTESVSSPFTLPRRVYTLATMNSVDKSIAPLDAALRRRFHVVELSPDLGSFAQDHLGLLDGIPEPDDITANPNTAEDVKRLAVLLLTTLNNRIDLFLGPDFRFGQWYLRDLVDAGDLSSAVSELARIWTSALLPQLLEYFGGRTEQLIGILAPALDDGTVLTLNRPTLPLEELGATAALAAVADASDGDIIAFLRKVAAESA